MLFRSRVKDYYCTLSALSESWLVRTLLLVSWMVLKLLTALLIFENALTLDREVSLFWKRKVTGASALFLSSRYITLLAYSVRTLLMANWSCAVSVSSR